MLFNSYIFILLFLPLTLVVYFALNKYACGVRGESGLWWLFLMSLWFYGYANPWYLILIISSIFVNFFLSKVFYRLKQTYLTVPEADRSKSPQRFALTAGLLFNFSLLFYFKYYDFFLANMNAVFHESWELRGIALPLGISFFTFQQVSFVIDCYRSEDGIDYRFVEYGAFVTYFPQLVAGPIVMHTELIPQFRDREKKRPDFGNLSRGLYAFALGLAKKVLIADTLSKFVALGFAGIPVLNGFSAVIVMLCYTLQIYFDFSGYCDMALGMAAMFNFTLPINFNSPYKARSIGEFWERWHMTLTRFFTRYVYIPLGGNRKGKLRTYLNTLGVFLLSGLWHGANWTFVIWGGIHGVFLTLEKIGADLGLHFGTGSSRFVNMIKGCVTFLIVNLGWILFRAQSFTEARSFCERLFVPGTELYPAITEAAGKLVEIRLLARLGLGGLFDAYPALPVTGFVAALLFGVFCMKNTQEKMAQSRYGDASYGDAPYGDVPYGTARSLVTVLLLVWCIISLSDVSEFLYFNF